MKAIGSIFAILFGLALLLLFGAGIYFGFQFMADLYRGLDTQVAATVFIIIIMILVGSLLMSWSRDWRTRVDRGEQLRLRRAELYGLLLDVWCAYLQEQRRLTGGEMPQNAEGLLDLEADLEAVERQLALWGSSNVLHAYVACREYASSHLSSSKQEVLSQASQLVSEMRKDIGTHDLGLREADVLSRLLVTPMEGRSGTSGRPSNKEQSISAPVTNKGQAGSA